MIENEQNNTFENWLNQHKALVYKVVRAYAFVAQDHDDLFQEIAIQVWRSIRTFRNESSVTTWIYRISLNTAIKWAKKEKKHSQREPLEVVEPVLQSTGVKVDERLEWLYEEIYKLDEIDRSITLLLLDNFSYKEMAGILGISESNVGVKINRIKKLLITRSKKF